MRDILVGDLILLEVLQGARSTQDAMRIERSGQIFVSLKIVETNNARILAAADFVTPRSWDVEQLLTGAVAAR